MKTETKDKIFDYLSTKYFSNENFFIDDKKDKILFKKCYSDQIVENIKTIVRVISHIYVSSNNYSYKLGFRHGFIIKEYDSNKLPVQ